MRTTSPGGSRVLVVGDLNPDIILGGDVVPRFGQLEQLLDDAQLVLGGSAGIAAHGLARLGRDVSLAAVVGRDVFGTHVRALLDDAGVDTRSVLTHPDLPTGLSVILSRGDDRAILTFSGTVPALTADDVRRAVDDRRGDGLRHVHVGALFLQPSLARELPAVLAELRREGLTVSLDTNDDPTGRWDGVNELLAQVDVFLPNRSEVLGVAGVPDVVQAAEKLAGLGPIVVVKDGSSGAFAVTPDGRTQRTTVPEQVAVDSTGAGDTFDAAFLDSWLDGVPLDAALRRAAVAGAIAVTAVGGTAHQPTRDELDAATEHAFEGSGGAHDN